LPAEAELVHLERLRLADGEPLAVDRVWLPSPDALPLLAADLESTGLYDQLAQLCGLRLTGGSERIGAVIPSPEQRELLALPDGVAAFAVDRIGHIGARAVEVRHTVIRADRFSVTADFSSRTGYRMDVAGTGPEPTPLGTPDGRRDARHDGAADGRPRTRTENGAPR
jgi:GntR family transcriptional regulator